MSTRLSPNTQAILLLTAPLIVGRGGSKNSVTPLSLAEYNQLALRLCQFEWQPADLLGTEARAVLSECADDADNQRIIRLLERGFLLSQALEHWQSRAIWVTSRADAEYPIRFKERLGKFAPPVLYGCGNATLLENGGLAVVGSRDANAEILEYAGSVGRLAAEAQYPIISGGARGVDMAAMRGVLSEGGTAVGILSGGLEKDAMNRSNRDLLINEQLVLVSPYDPKAGFNVGNAMQRNKLVYALSDTGLVVETDTKGGTWTGALEQLDKLHLVPIYARSEGEISKGISALRRKGALAWPNPETADDLRAVISGEYQYPDAEPARQPSLSLDSDAPTEPHKHDADGQIVKPVLDIEPLNLQQTNLADQLLLSVERLLTSIDGPITASDAAKRLHVSKKQAGDWLKRLEQAGKYQRRNKRSPYERVTQVNSLL